MPALVIPIIAEKDYRAFRKILRQYLPPHFESWAAETAKAVKNAERLKANIKRQPIAPDEFAAWLQARKLPADMSQLNAFAWEAAAATGSSDD